MLIAFSHLRWGFVWQRPQHLMSRFARDMPVLFVEEPEFADTDGHLRIRRSRGVVIATPVLPQTMAGGGFRQRVNGTISRLLTPLVDTASAPILWYYTPMARGAEPSGCEPGLAIYDAMDDLASFRCAPARMREQEALLLAEVDLVFTGGPTLFRQRSHLHNAVFCFPSGVEMGHFATAKNGIRRPEALNMRQRPILGYFGVIDERVDLNLIREIAGLRPDWTIALIGPIAKIDRSSIPARCNVVRFPQQAYQNLPAFLACFDVAILPFARNNATRAISPTKTLEYLAGGAPVVSTPIADVVELYGDVISIASSPREFVREVETVLSRSSHEESEWRVAVDAIVARNEWDAIADRMRETMARMSLQRRTAPALLAGQLTE